MMLSDVCRIHRPKSITERPRKTKTGSEVAHVTPGHFTHRHVGMSDSCSSGRGNVLAVGNCCYIAVFLAAYMCVCVFHI